MNMLATFARKSLGALLQKVSDLLQEEETPMKECSLESDPSEPEPPMRVRRPYDPKEHKTYYIVGSTLLRLMLDNPGPKTVKDLVVLSTEEFPQSTIRGICKELVKEGLLYQVAVYPAAFLITEGLMDRARTFVSDHDEPSIPATEAPEVPAESGLE